MFTLWGKSSAEAKQVITEAYNAAISTRKFLEWFEKLDMEKSTVRCYKPQGKFRFHMKLGEQTAVSVCICVFVFHIKKVFFRQDSHRETNCLVFVKLCYSGFDTCFKWSIYDLL